MKENHMVIDIHSGKCLGIVDATDAFTAVAEVVGEICVTCSRDFGATIEVLSDSGKITTLTTPYRARNYKIPKKDVELENTAKIVKRLATKIKSETNREVEINDVGFGTMLIF